MNYEPYNFDSFSKLIQHSYSLAWFAGTKPVFKLSCDNGFEAFSGRASETWETQFTLELFEIKNDSGKTINPAATFKARSVKEVCDEAIKLLNV